jgi:hypothetical protein
MVFFRRTESGNSVDLLGDFSKNALIKQGLRYAFAKKRRLRALAAAPPAHH